MKARKLIKNAVAELKASEAIDHWQKGRERIEAEDLLAFVMGGEELEPDDQIGEGERAEYLRLIERVYDHLAKQQPRLPNPARRAALNPDPAADWPMAPANEPTGFLAPAEREVTLLEATRRS